MPTVTATLQAQYAKRLQELITAGEKLMESSTVEDRVIPGKTRWDNHVEKIAKIEWEPYVRWRTSSTTLLGQLVGGLPHHELLLKTFPTMRPEMKNLQFGVAALRSLLDDLQRGFFSDIELRVAARLSSGLLDDAAQILQGNSPDHLEHVVAGILAGIVLEQNLRELCSHATPPIPTTKPDGSAVKANVMIDALRDSGQYTELTAKQLRAWYGMRNSLAHGDFQDIDKVQVNLMIQGIAAFLAQHCG
jgi:hypothetical protein